MRLKKQLAAGSRQGAGSAARPLTPAEVLAGLRGADGGPRFIVVGLRLPRTVLALAVGAALGLAGAGLASPALLAQAPAFPAKPVRIVIDSLSEIRLLAQSSLRYRRQILAIKHYFVRYDATVLLLDDLTTESLDKTVHSVAHGVIRLEQTHPDYGSERGRLRVLSTSSNCNLARLYRSMTLLLGMKPDEHEFKVMGLAPYGQPDRVEPQPQPAEGISLAPKVEPADARVDWSLPAHVVGKTALGVEDPMEAKQAVIDAFEEIFTSAKGKIVVAAFASSVYRMQIVVDLAAQFGEAERAPERTALRLAGGDMFRLDGVFHTGVKITQRVMCQHEIGIAVNRLTQGGQRLLVF